MIDQVAGRSIRPSNGVARSRNEMEITKKMIYPKVDKPNKKTNSRLGLGLVVDKFPSEGKYRRVNKQTIKSAAMNKIDEGIVAMLIHEESSAIPDLIML
jgi:hypothetical protein